MYIKHPCSAAYDLLLLRVRQRCESLNGRRWIVRVLAENNGVGQVFQPWAAAHVHNTAQRPAIPDGYSFLGDSFGVGLQMEGPAKLWRAQSSCK